MTEKEVLKWFNLITTAKTGNKLDYYDYSELLRLNYLVMELSHDIHNKNMLEVKA